MNPNSVWAVGTYGVMLAHQGKLTEALELMQRFRRLDPLAAFPWDPDPGALHVLMGDVEAGLEYWKTTLAVAPFALMPLRTYGTHLCRAEAGDAGVELLERARSLAPTEPETAAALGYCYAISGRQDEARALLADLEAMSQREYVDPTALALVRIGLGDADGSLAELERGLELGAQVLPSVALDPRYAGVRDDPRFQAIVRGMGLGSG